ncbi:MAG: GNAT family N-acetyltransferase, partial [Bacteroidia bacterium]|nr:GNAT family N-acetyltransferase [Bacteroidia bacterium]
MLSVAPRTQGQGIGKKLLAEAEAYATRLGCNAIFMTVISVRENLIAWYLRHGYALTGKKAPFVVPDERWGVPKQALEFVYLEKKSVDRVGEYAPVDFLDHHIDLRRRPVHKVDDLACVVGQLCAKCCRSTQRHFGKQLLVKCLVI